MTSETNLTTDFLYKTMQLDLADTVLYDLPQKNKHNCLHQWQCNTVSPENILNSLPHHARQ